MRKNEFGLCHDVLWAEFLHKLIHTMARATWKGNISFGLVNIPVQLYPAETHDKLDFHMLDKRDMSPIHYKTVNANTGEEISRKDVVKGFEYKKGDFVILNDEDFRKANVKATKTIDIQNFIERGQIPPGFFYKPYYIEPGENSSKSYALLRETLKNTGKIAVAEIVMSGRQHLCALMPRGDVIMMELLRFAHELKQPDHKALPPRNIKKLGIKPAELKMAEQLVDSMSGEWNPDKYKDTYQDDLKAFIKDKVKHGEHAEARNADEEPEVAEQESGKVVDFMSLLKRSIDKTTGHTPARHHHRTSSHRKTSHRRRGSDHHAGA
jgi:DNA end-binding protein Ku